MVDFIPYKSKLVINNSLNLQGEKKKKKPVKASAWSNIPIVTFIAYSSGES